MHNALKDLVARICDVRAELDPLIHRQLIADAQSSGNPVVAAIFGAAKPDGRLDHQLGASATLEQIRAIEQRAGLTLPPDYRAFLELHNGWLGFSGEHHLLSAEQMADAAFVHSIAETKAVLREDKNSTFHGDGLVIVASQSGDMLVVIAPTTQRADGTADVIQGDCRVGEFKRSPSFLAFLEGRLQLLERRLEKARARGV